ncbi:hypothetical protein J6590_012994 [Homalodisca vitripennis]|nr:hypothetical protein J6590_012994 [Homalodisca vitripennis]
MREHNVETRENNVINSGHDMSRHVTSRHGRTARHRGMTRTSPAWGLSPPEMSGISPIFMVHFLLLSAAPPLSYRHLSLGPITSFHIALSSSLPFHLSPADIVINVNFKIFPSIHKPILRKNFKFKSMMTRYNKALEKVYF